MRTPPKLFAILLALGLLGSGAWAEDLQARAEALGLARHPSWEALLHVTPRSFGLRRASEIPDGAFFLSGAGPKDPAAELVATLDALLDPVPGGDDAAHCRFPARTRWLAEALGIPLERLATAPCPKLEAWRADLSPEGITLIFPEAFMNNPASMFGHTLLRLDVADPNAPQNLLAYAIDFTANSGGEAGPVFLMKGTFGRYSGYFGVNPYYDKLELYGDWQNRDIWEYPLDLSADEIDFVLLHLWELDGIAIPYYFFRQNCSYQLIRLLAAARPELELRHGFPGGVIPVDTVRDVLDQIGLAGEVRYRPSPATELRVALAALDARDRGLALDLARGEIEASDARVVDLEPKERAAVLGTAIEAVRYLHATEEIGPDVSRERSYRLMVARSRAAPGAGPPVPRPLLRPDEGHGTALVSLGGGVEDDESFVELRLRPSFHGVLDPELGFPADSTISVLDTRVRWYPESGDLRLEELVLVELQSNTPRDRFFRPLSWGLDTGLRTRLFPEADGSLDRSLVWRTGGSLGLTFRPGDGPFTIYGLADARLEVGADFDGSFALGPGAELGIELDTKRDRWKGVLFARGTRFVLGDRETDLEAGFGQRITLTRKTALVAEVGYHYYDHESWLDATLSWQWTF